MNEMDYGKSELDYWKKDSAAAWDKCEEHQLENERLRRLVACVLDNDPGDMAADGVTVYEVWREEAERLLGRK